MGSRDITPVQENEDEEACTIQGEVRGGKMLAGDRDVQPVL
jgi:hypothetical protein